MTANGPFAEEEVKKWVKPGDWQKHVIIDTHGRTTGYRASPGEMYWLSELQKGKVGDLTKFDVPFVWFSHVITDHILRDANPREKSHS